MLLIEVDSAMRVGEAARIHLPGLETVTSLGGELEILSLADTLSADGAHLHIAIADSSGTVSGGHLCAGSLVRTTAELVLDLLPEWEFRRAVDPATGYSELRIRPNPNGPKNGAKR